MTETVSLRHVAATILDVAGVDPEPNRIQGETLLRYAQVGGGSEASDVGAGTAQDTVFAVLYGGAQDQPWYRSTFGPAMFALVDSTYHYILNGDGTEELYARRDDPGETENLAFDLDHSSILNSFRTTLAGLESVLPPLREEPPAHSPPTDRN
jgi:arylsulfatase A-like enzyme